MGNNLGRLYIRVKSIFLVRASLRKTGARNYYISKTSPKPNYSEQVVIVWPSTRVASFSMSAFLLKIKNK